MIVKSGATRCRRGPDFFVLTGYNNRIGTNKQDWNVHV